MPFCFLCDSFYQSVSMLITHIHIYHSINDITEFVCKVSNCFRIFDSLNSYKKHLKNSDKLNSNLQTQILNDSNLEIH